MSAKCKLPHTPLLYSKTGVYRGIPTFLIFDPKHRFWVLVRTASLEPPRRDFSYFLIQIIDSGYSLELTRRGSSARQF